MSGSPYSTDILRLAASTGSLERLSAPDGSAEMRSPVCGSRVRIDLAVSPEGRIDGIGVEVSACALGQASTALFARHAKGHSESDVAITRQSLADYLAGDGPLATDWPGLDVFERARAHPGRHAAILLPFDAAIAAFDEARS